MRAQAHADGQQVAEGVRDTARYVQSILGMDDTAFRASVFAEQKQLAAFSDQPPAERRRARARAARHHAARRGPRPGPQGRPHRGPDRSTACASCCPTLGELRAEADEAEALAVAMEGQAGALEAELEAARVAFEAGMRAYDRLEAARQEHERLVAEGRATRNELERSLIGGAASSIDELAALDADAARLAALAADADGWREAEARLRSVEAVVAARAALATVPVVVDPPLPDEEGYEKAGRRPRRLGPRCRRCRPGWSRHGPSANGPGWRSSARVSLTGEADCPLCGQALGDAFEAVQAHRAEELVVAEGNLVEAELDRRRAGQAATAATEAASAMAARRSGPPGRRGPASRRRGPAGPRRKRRWPGPRRPTAGRWPTTRPRVLSAEVERRRRAADECQRIRGRIERRPAVVAELDVERAAAAEVQGRLDMLRDKVMSLAFRPEELAAALAARDRLPGGRRHRRPAGPGGGERRRPGPGAGGGRAPARSTRRSSSTPSWRPSATTPGT